MTKSQEAACEPPPGLERGSVSRRKLERIVGVVTFKTPSCGAILLRVTDPRSVKAGELAAAGIRGRQNANDIGKGWGWWSALMRWNGFEKSNRNQTESGLIRLNPTKKCALGGPVRLNQIKVN